MAQDKVHSGKPIQIPADRLPRDFLGPRHFNPTNTTIAAHPENVESDHNMTLSPDFRLRKQALACLFTVVHILGRPIHSGCSVHLGQGATPLSIGNPVELTGTLCVLCRDGNLNAGTLLEPHVVPMFIRQRIFDPELSMPTVGTLNSYLRLLRLART
jgi:hypothetical protein